MDDYLHRAYGKDVGIGGYKCYCCGPAPKHRKRYRRLARRRDRQQVRIMGLQSLVGDTCPVVY